MAAGGRLDVSITEPAASVGVFVGAGLDAAVVLYDGDASPPFRGESGALWSAAPHVTAGVRYELASWLFVRADLLVAALLPALTLRAVGEPIATVGRPLLVPSLGLEAAP